MSDPGAQRTFRLTVAYDGTAFHGWQRQPGVRTVQGELERALRLVLEDARVMVAGAGRTDAGVHARGQVASFASDTGLPPRALPPLLDRVLATDVSIMDAAETPQVFHARHSATARRYVYRLLARPDVLWSRYAWWPRRPLSAEALARAAEPLAGTHDCSAFLAAGSAPVDPVCRLDLARWSAWEGGLAFEVQADHFLYHMVRNLVGTALAVSDAADPAAGMREVLTSRDRGRGGATAPPEGLCLEQVSYEGERRAR